MSYALRCYVDCFYRLTVEFKAKGPKHEIFESGFFYRNQTCTEVTWGLAKKMKFRKLESLFEGFRCEYLIKRMLSMRLKVVTNEKGEAVGDVLTIIC
jgi:hypothetical protein